MQTGNNTHHRPMGAKPIFRCDDCDFTSLREFYLIDHRKTCTGREEHGLRKCSKCQKKLSSTYIVRHIRTCKGQGARGAQGGDTKVEAQPPARVYKNKRTKCPQCGVEMAASSVARHLEKVCWHQGRASGSGSAGAYWS